MRRILLLASIVFLVALMSCAYASAATLVKAAPDAKIAYTDPAWSPNGKSIAYVGAVYATSPSEPTMGKADTTVYVANASGSGQHAIAKNSDWPVWSPDGKKLAVSHNGLATVDVSTGKMAQITKIADANTPDFPLSWSPNGRYIVHVAYGDAPKILIRDLKAGKDLSVTPGFANVWMADGKLLTAMCGPFCPAGGGWLKIIDPATGNTRTLLEGQCVDKAFIPKGAGSAWVYITENAPKGKGIYRVDLKTGVLSKMVALSATEVAWSPNAAQFAFLTEYSPRAGVEPKSTLYIGDTRLWAFKIAAKDAGKTEDKLHQHAQWSPNSKSIAYVSDAGDINLFKPSP